MESERHILYVDRNGWAMDVIVDDEGVTFGSGTVEDCNDINLDKVPVSEDGTHRREPGPSGIGFPLTGDGLSLVGAKALLMVLNPDLDIAGWC